jgi:hypothetical protein
MFDRCSAAAHLLKLKSGALHKVGILAIAERLYKTLSQAAKLVTEYR